MFRRFLTYSANKEMLYELKNYITQFNFRHHQGGKVMSFAPTGEILEML